MDNDTTIITERYEYFENHYNDLVKYDSWSKGANRIIRDAYCVNISPSWIEAQLRENRHIEIFIRIIQKCRIMRSSIEYVNEGNNKLLLEQVDNINRTYRNELLSELTQTIREYCL